MEKQTQKDGHKEKVAYSPTVPQGTTAIVASGTYALGPRDPNPPERDSDIAFYAQLRAGLQAISFAKLEKYLNELVDGQSALPLPFYGVKGWEMLRQAAECFLLSRIGICNNDRAWGSSPDERGKVEKIVDSDAERAERQKIKEAFVAAWGTSPLYKMFLDRLVAFNERERGSAPFYGLIDARLRCPLLIELIWSYWHEEGMLVQSVNAIGMRFQNRRFNGRGEALSRFEIEPLRPINNILWGYLQDEQSRLTVARRAHEYDHHYGLRVIGKAVGDLAPADTRSKFLQGFHFLLNTCVQLYKQEDDLQIKPNGFPVLNALKEVQMVLGEGMHNQYGDLPWTARLEMLMQQWLLARPEMEKFLGGRAMMPYPEKWMDRVQTMKGMMGWSDSSVVHFHELAVNGELILLSIRHGQWVQENDGERARLWANEFRKEITTYLHAYRAVTGVDLAGERVDFELPALHLKNRLAAQLR